MSESDSNKKEDSMNGYSKPDALDSDSKLEEAGEEDQDRTGGLFGTWQGIGKLFTVEDWLTILTRSRSLFDDPKKEDDNPDR